MKSKKLYEKAIAWAEKKGFKEIKANYEDYSNPTSFKKSGDEEAFVPDISGMHRGGKSYVEIAMKAEDETRLVSKWKLLATLAKMKDGELYLLTPKGHKMFTMRKVKEFNIEATIVSI